MSIILQNPSSLRSLLPSAPATTTPGRSKILLLHQQRPRWLHRNLPRRFSLSNARSHHGYSRARIPRWKRCLYENSEDQLPETIAYPGSCTLSRLDNKDRRQKAVGCWWNRRREWRVLYDGEKTFTEGWAHEALASVIQSQFMGSMVNNDPERAQMMAKVA